MEVTTKQCGFRMHALGNAGPLFAHLPKSESFLAPESFGANVRRPQVFPVIQGAPPAGPTTSALDGNTLPGARSAPSRRSAESLRPLPPHCPLVDWGGHSKTFGCAPRWTFRSLKRRKNEQQEVDAQAPPSCLQVPSSPRCHGAHQRNGPC